MNYFKIYQIGIIHNTNDEAYIKIDSQYITALKNLDGFSHINVLWWFSECDDEKSRQSLIANCPYKTAPEQLGTFATRSPFRPNPIAVSTVEITHIDYKSGIIYITYTDAHDNTPVLDIKPYSPSLDRVQNPRVPNWCSHWPKSLEDSAYFDWENELNF